MGVWAGKDVAKYVKGFCKINPGGVDLAPKQVAKLLRWKVILHGERRGFLIGGRFQDHEKVKLICKPDKLGYYHLKPMTLYELRFPLVEIPLTATGLCFPRSTLNRLGIIKAETAVLDSGYKGEFVQTIFVFSPTLIHKDEPLVQLIFLKNMRRAERGYEGRYQNERGV
ncbi:MAG: dCTP deaminase domain-containing protein [Thermoproteota archaeon]